MVTRVHQSVPLLLLALVSACVPMTRAALPPERLAPAPPLVAGSGTRLSIRVSGVSAASLPPGWHASASTEAEVEPEGMLRVPGCEAFDARGLTAVAIAQELWKRGLGSVPSAAQIFVEFVHNPHQVVSVVGQVAHPGVLQWTPGMTVVQALMMSGGFASSARKLVKVTARDRAPLEVDVEAIVTGQTPDVPLLPLDVLNVQ